jgi:hypothetical protein
MGILIRSTPAQFVSEYSLEESIERLGAVVKRSAFQVPIHGGAAGKVSAGRVSIRRVYALARNSFQPNFIGRFESETGHVLLTGVFTFHLGTRVFMAIWFGFLAFGTLSILREGGHNAGLALLIIFGEIGFGLGLMHGGYWISRHDITWLSSVIERALSRKNAAELADNQKDYVQ